VLALALAAALWGGARRHRSTSQASAPTLACAAWADVGRRFDAHTGEGRHVDGAAIDAMMRDLRGAVDALRAERRLDEAERLALAERLAAAERDRAAHAARTAILERELERHGTLLGAARDEAGADVPRRRRRGRDRRGGDDGAHAPAVARSWRSRSRRRGARAAPASRPRSGRLSQRGGRAALATALPTLARGLVVANLLDANPTLLGDVMAAAREGATIVAYAARRTQPHSRRRALLRRAAGAGEITAELDSQPRAGGV